MNKWQRYNVEQKKRILQALFTSDYTQTQAANLLSTSRSVLSAFCHRHSIKSRYTQGAQQGNKNAEIHGMGWNTIKRLTKRILLESGRDIFTCERCGHKDRWNSPLARHHKDRNRLNNTLDNLEVLCPTCHAVEHNLDQLRNEVGKYVQR